MSNQQSPISQINNSYNDQIDTIALRCEDTSLLPEHSDKNKQYNIISPRLSYWINIQRCWMCIIVIVAHITPSSYYEKSIATALIPHPFVAHGRAAVRMFFVFAAIFSMNSVQNLYEKHQDSTKQFTKALLYQYTKRYFQTHGILLVLGLGYAPFLYWVFGENGRDVYYIPWRQYKRYWLTWFLPVYLPWRDEGAQYISGSAWFNQQLTNNEFFFYCFFYLGYFLKKIVSNQLVWVIVFQVVTTIITNLLEELAPGCRYIRNYCFGVGCYWFRYILTSTKYGQSIIQLSYSKCNQLLVYRWIITIFFIYLWLFMCRLPGNIPQWAHVPYSIFLMCDLIPFPKFTPFWQTIIDEISRLLMPIYILHYAFINHAAPRNFPYVTALNQEIENNHSWINAFSSWIYLLIFGMLSYPLWFMQRPLEVFPVWLKQVVEKKHLKDMKKFKVDLALSAIGLVSALVLVVLAQSDVFGHDFVDLPPLWK
ncbi:Conserved_hypothetical protein [Hexamita inflata]|uniref:Uncharacterized protein n=2 Tax=Hexamita inflata TaxID=28002 RepID=A0AA86QZP3_9EUKA|nr:Conserved hypothetical protein [Hexamita inflata]